MKVTQTYFWGSQVLCWNTHWHDTDNSLHFGYFLYFLSFCHPKLCRVNQELQPNSSHNSKSRLVPRAGVCLSNTPLPCSFSCGWLPMQHHLKHMACFFPHPLHLWKFVQLVLESLFTLPSVTSFKKEKKKKTGVYLSMLGCVVWSCSFFFISFSFFWGRMKDLSRLFTCLCN